MTTLEDPAVQTADESVAPPIAREDLEPEVSRFERWLPALIAISCAAVWELFSRIGLIPAYFFPAPSVTFRTIFELSSDGRLASDTAITAARLIVGFATGGSVGLLLGLLMGYSRRIRRIVDPFVAAAHPIPKLALFPLIMIIFGIGETSKVVLVAIGVFFPMLINAMAGVRQISPINFEVAENFGAGRLKVFTRVVLPGSMPLVLAGTRVALNMALLITIAIELVSARTGLGALIWNGWQTFRVENIYAGIVVISLMGIGISLGLKSLTARLVPWQPDRAN